MFPILLIATKRTAEGYVKKHIKEQMYPITHIHIIEPLTTIITIDQIREIIKTALYTSQKTLIVIYNFETAKKESQNAFLKTLEEKNNSIQFILQATGEYGVLPTITSRSMLVRLKSSGSKKQIANQTIKDLLMELDMQDYGEMTKEKAIHFCNRWLSIFHTQIEEVSSKKQSEVIKELIRVSDLIQKNNINPQLSIDHLILLMKDVI